ncbi:hypothetical protein LPJ53_004498 [Coemansia erecta]|uniref:GH18 domain-containing protein n=1 Tax=Coemansia erecta TaxID=147472 RepID=A0A9W7XXM6_9FUNG|nr:hypothetical protein LPJ53_004498 [Coemansia erecta]
MHYLCTSLLGTALAFAVSVSGSIIAGYAPGWKDVGTIDVSKYTHINLAYAEPQANGTLTFEASYNVAEYSDKIHKVGTRVLLAVGGYSGSIYMSDALKEPESRSRLANSIVDFIKENRLDGVDIDWISNKCNHVDLPNDAANLLIFVRELRQSLDSTFAADPKKLIVLGVGVSPFAGPDGPVSDVSEYANSVDYINILAYDINGPEDKTTGPNAPLNYEYNRGVQQSLISAVDSWTAAKFPANKITVGLAFYGRSSKTTANMTTQPWNVYQPLESSVPKGDGDDGLWADRCTSKPASYSGIWSYRNMRTQGLLKSNDTALSPWQRYWDSVSLTPWLFNPESKIYISYDDPTSLSAKANYALSKNLGGVTIYDATMDLNDELLAAITGILKPDAPLFISASLNGTEQIFTSSSLSTSTTVSLTQPPPTSEPTDGVPTTILTSNPVDAPTSSLISSTGDSASTPLPSSTTYSSSSSTSADVTPTTTSSDATNEDGKPHAGSSCGWNPVYQCIENDGRNPFFMTCAAGVWVQQQCAPGTACVQNGDYIYCDWPR